VSRSCGMAGRGLRWSGRRRRPERCPVRDRHVGRLQHRRMERPKSRRKELNSATGVSVASHNGALHVFGAAPGFGVTHSRSFSGANWQVNVLDEFERGDFFHVNPLPPSASALTTGYTCSASLTMDRSGRCAIPPTEGRGLHPGHARPSALPRGSRSRPSSSVTAFTSLPEMARHPSCASRRARIC
jgi:hypothetical protein